MTERESNDAESFLPTASLAVLRERAELLRQLRAFFDSRGFFEVSTPVLSADTVVDLHLDPLRVIVFDDPKHVDVGPTWFLQTSPEFHMKRLLAAGAQAIYQIGPAFRGAEQGDLHNLEFTIAEWYRCGDELADGMRLLSEVAQTLLDCESAEEISYAAAFEAHTGLDPHLATLSELRNSASRFRTMAQDDSLDDCREVLWTHLVEPRLGPHRPAIVFDYPASQAALACIRPGDPPLAERFELYFQGIELANGYVELTNAEEFSIRMAETSNRRIAAGKPPLPSENRLLRAMQSGIPPTTGVAMGFDRVAMLRFGERKLEKVLSFPRYRA